MQIVQMNSQFDINMDIKYTNLRVWLLSSLNPSL